MSTTLERVTKIVAEQLGKPVAEVQPGSNFVLDLGADSLDKVELCMYVEDEFGVEIPDAEAVEINTPQGYVDWVDSHKRLR